MNNALTPHIVRFILLTLMQGLVFNNMSALSGSWPVHVFIYPLFILFLPLDLRPVYAVLLGFAIGLMVDQLSDTWALHAAAGSVSGYGRYLLLRASEPKGGFSGKEAIPSPHWFGYGWFFRLAAGFFFIHMLWFFLLDAFNFVQLGSILFKTLLGWLFSMAFAAIYVFLFNPKQ